MQHLNTYNAPLDQIIALALAEDIGFGDITTQAAVSSSQTAQAMVIAKEPLVVSGTQVFQRVCHSVDPSLEVTICQQNGTEIKSNTVVLQISGKAQSILTAERTALNFLQRLCGIATQAHHWRRILSDFPNVALLDTRKTTPALRQLEKAAVRDGKCANHRFGLYDGVLIKENHIALAGSIERAVQRARQAVHHLHKIEIEVVQVQQVQAALDSGVDALLLDNMSNVDMISAIDIVRTHERNLGRRIFVEASGNMTEARLVEVAKLGVDGISMGALTHSVRAADLSLLINVATTKERT